MSFGGAFGGHEGGFEGAGGGTIDPPPELEALLLEADAIVPPGGKGSLGLYFGGSVGGLG